MKTYIELRDVPRLNENGLFDITCSCLRVCTEIFNKDDACPGMTLHTVARSKCNKEYTPIIGTKDPAVIVTRIMNGRKRVGNRYRVVLWSHNGVYTIHLGKEEKEITNGSAIYISEQVARHVYEFYKTSKVI